MTTPGPVSPDSSKGSQIARGVAVGILQLIFMNLTLFDEKPNIFKELLNLCSISYYDIKVKHFIMSITYDETTIKSLQNQSILEYFN